MNKKYLTAIGIFTLGVIPLLLLGVAFFTSNTVVTPSFANEYSETPRIVSPSTQVIVQRVPGSSASNIVLVNNNGEIIKTLVTEDFLTHFSLCSNKQSLVYFTFADTNTPYSLLNLHFFSLESGKNTFSLKTEWHQAAASCNNDSSLIALTTPEALYTLNTSTQELRQLQTFTNNNVFATDFPYTPEAFWINSADGSQNITYILKKVDSAITVVINPTTEEVVSSNTSDFSGI